MYILTTLGNAHKNVWEDAGEDAFALFSSRYDIKTINRLWEEVERDNKVYAIGRYMPYYGKNKSRQGEPAQFDHSSLLLIKGMEDNDNKIYDIKVKFQFQRKISADDTCKINNLVSGLPVPLVRYVDNGLVARRIWNIAFGSGTHNI